MAKKKQTRPGASPNNPSGVVRRPGERTTGSVSERTPLHDEEKQTSDIRILGWLGTNTWLLSVLYLGATVALGALMVMALVNGTYGVFLPIGFGLLALSFLVRFLESFLKLQLGQTGKWLKSLIPLVALVCLVVGLTIKA